MDIRNCKKCDRMYAYDGFDVCIKCRNVEDEMFKKVKEYLYDHPGADIQTVSTETGVEVKKILRYLREGKLEIKSDSPNFILDCERCGKAITTGRFCDKCILELQRELKSVIIDDKNKDKDKKDKDKMYLADRYKK
ncbi:flagellar operon protein YvyF [Gottschalkia purinilytica]|uniref:Flagellar operon protein YvyF n=1 Tax=Gottschalkia purinilytica TaxID=1503 RepID=A0A0L0WDZ9_GOTPU|nr:TIGR03826 family flagellar region protein [Gottschalkia purinilytica]KNF09661.1 flagellar operon protein YvyF [Gottschalkia purinilytica]